MGKDFYKILELNRSASNEEIKRAYKKMALKYHPDKNKSPEAVEMFQLVNQANEILSNSEKKEMYDKFGEAGLENMDMRNQNPFPFNMNPFANMHRHNYVEEMTHTVTLTEIFTQTQTSIKIKHLKNCDICDATGFTDKKNHLCKMCNGNGTIFETIRLSHNMVGQQTVLCRGCMGRKIDMNSAHMSCHTCNGSGNVNAVESVRIDLSPNLVRNPVIFVKGKWKMQNGQVPDFQVLINIEYPDNFSLSADKKLSYKQQISLAESLCGFTKVIHHPSGKKILLESEPGNIVDPYVTYKISNWGFQCGEMNMNIPAQDENYMHLEFIINYPANLTMAFPNNAKMSYKNIRIALGGVVANETDDDVAETINISKLAMIDPPIPEDRPEFAEHPPGCTQQ
uniref:J domain-containing protein n=1 Tax=viral metagenome TaxID=1070528 RepID=A0A6C0CD11_9ZZZZ